jgi:predicted acyl esterase
LDNLVPLKKGLYGEQTAGWSPGRPAREGLGCVVLADQMIPVEPGVSLAADIYLPKVPGRYPAVVLFAAYTKELHTAGVPAGTNEVGSPPVFTERGYVHLIVARRGMGRSGGKMEVFFGDQETSDLERVIAWAASQPWCDGQVVMFGTSYYGCVQPLVAVRNPPALKAFFSIEMCTDYFRHIAQFGGSPALYFFSVWMGANFSKGVVELRVPPVVRAVVSQILNSRFKSFWWPRLQKRLPALMRAMARQTPVREVREIWVNWIIDGKTRETHSIPPGPYAELDKITIPFVTVQNLGQFNLHQFGSYELFEKASTPTNRKWLIIAPPSYKLPVYEWQLEALAFFDHVLRESANGYADQAPVRYWLDGANRFASARDFPIPESQSIRLYPSSNGADTAIHHLSEKVPDAGSNRWAAIPLGAPLIGGLGEVINQTLTYEMPIDEEVEFSGPVTAHLRFSSNEIDSFVMVRLGRVDRTGSYHGLSFGMLTPSRRMIDSSRGSAVEIALETGKPEPLVPNQPVTLRFSLTPGPTRLQPGEKLRLEVASRTDLLESDTAHDHAHFHLQVPPYFSRNTLHYGADTFLELGKVG